MDISPIVLFFALFETYSSSPSQNRTALMNALLFNASTDVRPGLEYDRPLEVRIFFELIYLAEFNEVNGYISALGFFDVVWTDERMTWDPYDYGGIVEMFMPTEKVFVPKLIIPNGYERIYTFHEIAGGEIMYNFTGEAFWATGTLMKTRCPVDVQVYPFDEHQCYIEVTTMNGNYGEAFSELVFDTPILSFWADHFRGNPEWELTKVCSDVEIPDPKSNYSMVFFEMTFRRKTTFIIINIILPVYILSMMNTVVFLLPESGERVSVSVAVLLFFAVLLDVIGKIIPRTASPLPYLCYYAITVYLSSGGITFSVILFEKMYNNQGNQLVPRWLHISLCCLKPTRHKQISCVSTQRMHKPSESNDNVMKLESENVIQPEFVNFVKPELINWKQAIAKLNKIMFVFWFITVNLLFLVYMVFSGFRIRR